MRNNIKQRKKMICIAILILIAILTGWVIWSNVSIQTSRFIIKSDELPDEFDSFSIAHISDLHNAEFGKNNEKLVSILREENPNIIALTGDLIDSNHTNIEIALSFVRQAAEIAPCYYVTGNHEAWIGSQYDEMKTALEKMGVVVLEDEAVELEHGGASIQLIGLNDPAFAEREASLAESILETRLSRLNIEDGYTILLSHRPEHFKVYQDKNIDLVLSGHVHGGQFRLPFIGGIVAPNYGLFPKYDAGIYTEKETTMVVSRGLGNSVIPVRFNNRPEIVMAELKKAAAPGSKNGGL